MTEAAVGATAPPPPPVVPAVVRRRLAPHDHRRDPWSWSATGVVVAVAALLRLADLAHPPGKSFDEVYYAREGWALLTHGVEWNVKDDTASYVVHPPLGKWLIAVGEWTFGYADAEQGVRAAGHLATTAPEFGWRISAALAGILSVLLTVRIARRLLGSTVLGCAAGLLLALDGFHVVLSRTALLDIFLLLFVLAAFGALLADRDRRRRRWLRAMDAGLDPTARGRDGRIGFRWPDGVPWWRLAAAVLFGCAVGVKWSALFLLPAFALLVLWWEAGARRSAGARRPWRDTFLDETGWLVLCGVLIAAVYLASWSGWLLGDDGYFRHWLADNGRPEPPVLGALQNLAHYHHTAFDFHSTLQKGHSWQSWPWQWLLNARPVAIYWSGDGPCGAATCATQVLLLGTPVLWWSFLPALAATAYLGLAHRDWRAGALLLVTVCGLGPWFWYAADAHRTMFSFYTAPVLPFLVMAVVYALGALRAPVVTGAYLAVVTLCYAYFHPVFVGGTIPYDDWLRHMWLGPLWHTPGDV